MTLADQLQTESGLRMYAKLLEKKVFALQREVTRLEDSNNYFVNIVKKCDKSNHSKWMCQAEMRQCVSDNDRLSKKLAKARFRIQSLKQPKDAKDNNPNISASD